LRDHENVPLDEDIDAYMAREVHPHVPDAWADHSKTKIGYEIPFTRHFYVYQPPRPLAEIDAELKELEGQIQQLLGEVTEGTRYASSNSRTILSIKYVIRGTAI